MGAAIALSTLPLLWRAGIGAILGLAAGQTLRTTVALRGPRAMRGLEWTGQGDWRVLTGQGRILPAIPGNACRRYGQWLWVLRFETPEGAFQAVIDAGKQEQGAIRALSRELAATIGPKV